MLTKTDQQKFRAKWDVYLEIRGKWDMPCTSAALEPILKRLKKMPVEKRIAILDDAISEGTDKLDFDKYETHGRQSVDFDDTDLTYIQSDNMTLRHLANNVLTHVLHMQPDAAGTKQLAALLDPLPDDAARIARCRQMLDEAGYVPPEPGHYYKLFMAKIKAAGEAKTQ